MSSHNIDIPGTVTSDTPAFQPVERPSSGRVPKVLQNTAVAESYEHLHEVRKSLSNIAKFNENASTFSISVEQLGQVVNFDERNNKEQLKVLNSSKYGGVEGIAKMLRVDPNYGLRLRNTDKVITLDGEKKKSASTDNFGVEGVTDGLNRQAVFGRNIVPPPPTDTILEMVWETIKEDPIIKILLVGSVVIFIIGMATHDPATGWIDGTAIFIAVFIVLSVTAGNDWSKDRKFKKLLMLQSDKRVKVLRNGKVDQISSWDLLVGDVVELAPGDEVPADGLYVRGNRLIIDESPLTGESLPVKKDPEHPFVFSGCQVGEGSGYFLVTAVGPRSSAGQIQAMLNEKQSEETPLQQKLEVAAVQIGKIGIASGILTFLGLLVRWGIVYATKHQEWNTEQLLKIVNFFVIGVTVVVVAVPEGLPLAVTISLAFSMYKMIRDNCFVRQLAASETMGQATCVCTDKTGTLTENRMTVVKIYANGQTYCGEGSGDKNFAPFSAETFKHGFRDLLCESIAMNSTCFVKWKPKDPLPLFVGSSTEGALLILADKLGVKYEQVRERVKKIQEGELPFSSDRKRMTTTVEPKAVSQAGLKSKFRVYAKGASEIMLSLCSSYFDNKSQREISLSNDKIEEVSRLIKQWASEGLRTLVLAYRDLDSLPPVDEESGRMMDLEVNLVFMTLIAIKDPIRKEVPLAVAQCQRAGLVVRMVTGDNILTACSIAKECGIMTNQGVAMEGPQFRALSKEEKINIIPRLQVLARSSPADKYTLVTLLREMGEVVSVTGDGTNDAPALKAADVGFAMGISGTQIAMNACSIVLLDDNFASIVQAIRWGRNVLEVIRKFLQFQLSVNLSAIIITFLGSLIEGESPLSAVQLLWVNLIMDSLGALALASEEPDENILGKQPQKRTTKIITRNMWQYVGAMTVYQVSILLFVLFKGYQVVGFPEDYRDGEHTMVFTTFVLMQVVNEITARQLEHEINFVRGIFKNPIFLTMIFLICLIQTLAVQFGGNFMQTIALNGTQWGGAIVLSLGIVPYIVITRFFFQWYNARVKNAEVVPTTASQSQLSAAAMKQVVVEKTPMTMATNLVSP